MRYKKLIPFHIVGLIQFLGMTPVCFYLSDVFNIEYTTNIFILTYITSIAMFIFLVNLENQKPS